MAFSTQFALSLELSKTIPLVLSTASRGLIHLVRELQNSGSDIVAEHDLAEIFGRNFIEPKFASTFKTAVKQSAIHRLSDFAELVLEAGAGPTVRRSVDDPAYFSMVVQLSLLTWAHETHSLTRALIKALERRNPDKAQPLPRFDILLGTLRCCRQQTSGFMWELIFSAVEDQLKDVIPLKRPYESRPIPYIILQALLDAFTAVQRLPENHYLQIQSIEGVVTLVVWAHRVLGMTVEVHSDLGRIKFGTGDEVVSIGCTVEDSKWTPSVTLLDETQDTIFKASMDAIEDAPLEPACRHPAFGYGSKVLSLDIDDALVAHEIMQRIISSCLLISKQYNYAKQQVLRAGRLLFPQYEVSQKIPETVLAEGCVALHGWLPDQQPAFLADYIQHGGSNEGVQRLMKRLTNVVLALSMIRNLDECGAVPLSLYPRPGAKYLEVDHRSNVAPFELVAFLLLGKAYDEDVLDRAAVLSSWGWSLCMSSVVALDPATMTTELAILQGVPSRSGERKEWIVDTTLPRNSIEYTSKDNDAYHHFESRTIVAHPKEQITLRSFMASSNVKHFVGTTDLEFEVFKRYTGTTWNPKRTATIRFGLRGMQNLYWQTYHFPDCDHTTRLGEKLILPDKCCAFEGFKEPLHEPSSVYTSGSVPDTYENGWVNLCLSAGDSSTRWMVLYALIVAMIPKGTTRSTTWLRGDNCCVDCAIQIAKERMGPRRNTNIIL
ncbi:hypothetical protein MMC06_006795 [Schaereria dolodes]|nr:hypothetical protein [Schaereria dolodes]